MTQNKRLVARLEELVGHENYHEITEIIEFLLLIEKFKTNLSETPSTQLKFEKIQNELEKLFNIHNVKIVQTIEGIDTVRYYAHNNKQKDFDYTFEIAMNPKALIKAELYNEHLTAIEKIKLDSFLDGILTYLYLTIVIDTLQETALLDPLTGLKNRMAFTEEMKDIIPLALREKMNIGVLILNIDRFRAVNDEHGTQFGDKFLQNYADEIKRSIRSSDIAIRFGGGEFLILLLNVSNEEKTFEIAKEIQNNLNNAYIMSPYNDPFYKTISIGISMFPEDSLDIFEAVHFASSAVSDAKDLGRSQILRFTPEDEGDLDLF